MNTKLKIMLVLVTMMLMCLGSVSNAGPLDYSSRIDLTDRMFAFAAELLEPTVFEGGESASGLEVESTGSLLQLQATGSEVSGGGEADPAFMPFMSFENFSEELL